MLDDLEMCESEDEPWEIRDDFLGNEEEVEGEEENKDWD